MRSPNDTGRAKEGTEAGAFFDEWVERYDRAYDASGPNGYKLRSRMAGVLRLLGDGPGDVLDAGMGPGRLLASLDRRGWTVTGVDASAEMIGAARRRLPEAADRLVQGEIESLPFGDASFDAVAATGVLEYADVTRALDELTRVLRPGGLAVVSYPNPRPYYVFWQTRVWYPLVRGAKAILGRPARIFSKDSRLLSPARFESALHAAGLGLERVEFTCYLVLPSPLDELPGLTEYVGTRLEGSGPGLGWRLAAQPVYAARKP